MAVLYAGRPVQKCERSRLMFNIDQPDSAPDNEDHDGDVVMHGQGSFFGRRKGHKLRAHQADLIENLLPHLSLQIDSPAPEPLTTLFDPRSSTCASKSVSAVVNT